MPETHLPNYYVNITIITWKFETGKKYTFFMHTQQKNEQTVINMYTSCEESVHKLSTSSLRLVMVVSCWNKLLTTCIMKIFQQDCLK